MKFRNTEDVEAGIDEVFARVTDFDAFQRAAMSRGADVVRTDNLQTPAPGMTWKVAADFRGKRRNAVVEMTAYSPPGGAGFIARSQGFEITLDVELIALAPRRTRLVVQLLAKPNNLAARIVLQSMRLAKASLNRRFRARMRGFATSIEDRVRLTARA